MVDAGGGSRRVDLLRRDEPSIGTRSDIVIGKSSRNAETKPANRLDTSAEAVGCVLEPEITTPGLLGIGTVAIVLHLREVPVRRVKIKEGAVIKKLRKIQLGVIKLVAPGRKLG